MLSQKVYTIRAGFVNALKQRNLPKDGFSQKFVGFSYLHCRSENDIIKIQKKKGKLCQK